MLAIVRFWVIRYNVRALYVGIMKIKVRLLCLWTVDKFINVIFIISVVLCMLVRTIFGIFGSFKTAILAVRSVFIIAIVVFMTMIRLIIILVRVIFTFMPVLIVWCLSLFSNYCIFITSNLPQTIYYGWPMRSRQFWYNSSRECSLNLRYTESLFIQSNFCILLPVISWWVPVSFHSSFSTNSDYFRIS